MFQILLAEDNPGDVRLFIEALNSFGLSYQLAVAEDGQKAIAMVKGAAEGSQTRPDVIVLDVNLPRRNGDDVLRQIRAEPALRGLPVIMLTSSESPADYSVAKGLGADLYLRKPSNLEELLEIARIIEGVLTRAPGAKG